MSFRTSIILVVGLLVAPFGCKDEETVLAPAEVCKDVDCSGHGRCAVTAENTAVCLCDPGYHAEGLDCEADTPGAECDGVSCSGHGTCVVVQGEPNYPMCVCDEGYHLVGRTNRVEDQGGGGLECGPGTVEYEGQCIPKEECPNGDCTPDICNSAADCESGEVCVYETGECVPASEFQCEPPAEPEGDQGPGRYCGVQTKPDGSTVEHWCASGLRCVDHWWMLQEDGSWEPVREYYVYEEFLTGRCMEACNPCEGDCSDGRPCIGLESGGGFCAPGPLAVEGEVCRVGPVETAYCEAGTMCHHESPAGDMNIVHCGRMCVPEDLSVLHGNHWLPSTDCPAGSVCTCSETLDVGFHCTCQPGELTPVGGSCGEGSPGAVCEPGSRCVNTNLQNGKAVPGTCSTDSGDCPPGVNLRFQGRTAYPREACVAPGAVKAGGYCEEDIDCEPPLKCFQHLSEETWGYCFDYCPWVSCPVH